MLDHHMGNASYSTIGFQYRSVEKALAAIAAAGFPQAEILGQEPHVAVPPTGQALFAFCTLLEDLGLRARTVHAPMRDIVLGVPEENWRRENVKVLGTYIQFTGALGASDIIIHPVPNPGYVPNADDPTVPGLIRDAVPRSLDELIPVAEKAGVRILLENLPYDCDYPLLTMQELRPFVDAYPEERLGLVLDTGHAWTHKKDPASEIYAAGPRLGGTHLQDVDFSEPNDDHWVPTHGGLDWKAIRRALSQVQYAGPWTFEVANPRHGESPEDLARSTREVAQGWGL